MLKKKNFHTGLERKPMSSKQNKRTEKVCSFSAHKNLPSVALNNGMQIFFSQIFKIFIKEKTK